MKHVFINHSNITRIVILNIINDDKLEKKNCIIFNLRDQKKIRDYQFCQPLSFYPYIEKYRYHRLIILSLAIILKLQILLLTRGKFTLYAPNYSVEFVRAISILSNCVCKCQLEDGFVNYKYTVDQCKNLFFRKSKGRFKNLFDSSGLVSNSCVKYYCIDQRAFVGEALMCIVNKNILEKFITKVKHNEELNIFILEPITNFAEIEEYQNMIVKFLAVINKRNKIPYFKFHPEQSSKEIKMIKKFIDKVRLNEVSYLKESIEILLLKKSNVVIHSKISSLLIYQYLFTNKKGYCYEQYSNSQNENLNIMLNYAYIIDL